MAETMQGIFSMFGEWTIGGVSIVVWIIGFLLLSVVAIFVKGNR